MPNISHVPSEEGRKLVELHCSVGTPQEIIARILHISEKTLRKYYREELDVASAKANATVGGKLYNRAVVKDDITAQIFWLKTRAGWKERLEVAGPGGGPVALVTGTMTPEQAEAAYRATLAGGFLPAPEGDNDEGDED